MASRYEIRSIVIQTLFEADFRDCFDTKSVLDILKRNTQTEFGLENIPPFAESLATGVILKKDVLDEIIQKTAVDWPLSKISVIDRTLLRLGLFELLYGSVYNIPHKVAINEAIELAKAFGGDSSRKFVNGVLGAVYKEVETQEDTKTTQDFTLEELVGGLIYKKTGGEYLYGLILDPFKHFTLSKGHLKENEDYKPGLERIIQEETAIKVEVKDKIGENTYNAQTKIKKICKHVQYFLVKVLEEGEFKQSEGVKELKWFTSSQILDTKIYKDMLPIIEKGIQLSHQE